MAPLIDDQPVVGEWNPEARLFTVRGWVPGPAGAAAVALGDGVELEIDVASPGVLTALTVEAPWDGDPRSVSDRARRVVEGLLGPERLASLFELAGSGEPVVRSLARRDPWRAADEERGVDRRLAGVALAAMHAEADDDVLARVAARLDAVIGRARLGQPYSSRRRARDAANAALAAVGDLADLWTPSRPAARALSELIARAGRLAGDEVTAARLTRRTEPPVSHHVAAAMPMPMAAEPARPSTVLDVELSGLTGGLPSSVVFGARRRDCELEVRAVDLAERTDGWWARARDGRGTPLALSPFFADGRDAVARLLVPPVLLRSAILDVTDTPAVARPTDGRAAFDAALAAGRSAARLERLGRLSEARRHWSECAAQHERAGDQTRAAQAHDRVDGERERQRNTRPGRQPAVRLRSDIVGADL